MGTTSSIDLINAEIGAMNFDVRSIARALGGDARGRSVLAPGPGHSPHDRSLSILFDSGAPDGFVVKSFAGDDVILCRDYVRARLGISSWEPRRSKNARTANELYGNPSSEGQGRHLNIGRGSYEVEPINEGLNISRQRIAQWPETPKTIAHTRAAFDLFEAAKAISGIGEQYLVRRIRRLLAWSTDLRFHPACPRRFENRLERHPAILALLRDVRTNQLCGIQRIFLRSDGFDRLRDRMGKATLGRSLGACIKLSPDEAVTLGLGISEGLETSLKILSRGWSPIWCALSASGIAKFPVVAGIESLTIFADHDVNGAGERAALECIERWAEAGREARGIRPRASGNDWNDVSDVAR